MFTLLFVVPFNMMVHKITTKNYGLLIILNIKYSTHRETSSLKVLLIHKHFSCIFLMHGICSWFDGFSNIE